MKVVYLKKMVIIEKEQGRAVPVCFENYADYPA